MDDFWQVMGITLGGVMVALIGIFGCAQMGAYMACNKYELLTDHQTSFSISTQCLINVDGRWMNADTYMKNSSEIKVK